MEERAGLRARNRLDKANGWDRLAASVRDDKNCGGGGA